MSDIEQSKFSQPWALLHDAFVDRSESALAAAYDGYHRTFTYYDSNLRGFMTQPFYKLSLSDSIGIDTSTCSWDEFYDFLRRFYFLFLRIKGTLGEGLAMVRKLDARDSFVSESSAVKLKKDFEDLVLMFSELDDSFASAIKLTVKMRPEARAQDLLAAKKINFTLPT